MLYATSGTTSLRMRGSKSRSKGKVILIRKFEILSTNKNKGINTGINNNMLFRLNNINKY